MEEDETVAHLFRDCRFTKMVLQGVGVDILQTDIEQEWKHWNKCYNEGKKERVQDVVDFIKAYISQEKNTRGP
ncbi:hypothetical protein EPI10_015235 [Gossypium australe]|uniref:Uncharacterized protein n=1 Tax=Gossypium australe TaxID=47621 RepID=A0A5B6VKB8_9ROSI|nr:hypothetical protein EPI10_015235 [Gossypium australe]